MIFASRLAPLALLVCPDVETLKSGANFRLWHDPTWKWLEIPACAPSVLNAVPENDCGLQFVGLNMNSGRSITALIVRRSVGMPSRIDGSGSVVTVSCAVCGSTLIAERTTIVPRLNGPAITG